MLFSTVRCIMLFSSKCRKPIVNNSGICGNQDCVGADLTFDDSNNCDFR